MDINRENYESWFLDYIEGSLTAGQISQVHHFVSENPDLQKEFSEWKQILLKPDLTVVFHDKESLKRRRRILPIGWVQGLGAVAAVGLLVWLALPLVRQHPQDAPRAVVADVETMIPAPNLSGEGDSSPSQQSPEEQFVEQQVDVTQPQPTGSTVRPNLKPAAQKGTQTGQAQQMVSPEPAAMANLASPDAVKTVAAQRVSGSEAAWEHLAQATERPIIVDKESASIALEPGFFRKKIDNRLPADVGSLLAVTQSATQNATRGLASFMSGESDWFSLAAGSTARETDRDPVQDMESIDEARVFRFSIGGFKVYHRKTTKTDS